MRRTRTSLVAALAVTGAATLFGAPSSEAQLQNMLLQGIQAPGAGINVGSDSMVKGTIQYTNSAGSNDAFSVGTSTNISSNASASSTSDYAVSADANFAMGNNGANCEGTCGGLTTINQTIGLSGATNSSRETDIDRSLSASRSAELTATTEIDKSYKREHNGTAGWWYWGNNKWNSTTESDYTSKREAAYTSAYNAAYTSSFSALTEASGQDGTISGLFIKDAGESTSTISDSYTYRDASGAAVAGSVDRNSDGSTTFTAASGSGAVISSDLTRTTSFVQDKAASNDVTVKGIGANNNVVASDTANFTTEILKGSAASTDSGTASGSAAGGVNTTASASASSSTFVNSFVQAY